MPHPSEADLTALAGHQARVRRLVRALLGDHHATEDVVQEAWMRTLRGGPREPGAMGAWFGRVAERLALNVRRGDARRVRREIDRDRESRGSDAGVAPSSAEVVARLELQRRLTDSLDALSEPHRSLLRDHYLGEQSLAALARRDGVPEGTLRSRLMKARALLRDQLDAASFEGEGGSSTWMVALAPIAFSPGTLSTAGPPIAATALASAAALTMKKLLLVIGIVALVAVGLRFAGDSGGPSRLDNLTEEASEAELADVGSSQAADGPAVALEVVGEVPRDETTRVELVPEDAKAAANTFILTGRVQYENSDRVVGIRDVHLRMIAGFDSSGSVLEETTLQTEADGSFVWSLPAPGQTVTFTARAGRPPVDYERMSWLTVRPERKTDSYEVRLLACEASVHGTVRDPSGAPVKDATVSWGRNSATTDSQGRYELMVYNGAVYRIWARHEDFGEVAHIVEDLEQSERRRLDFHLPTGYGITGTVVDPNGAPIQGARVKTFHGGIGARTTDAQGRYRLAGLSRTAREEVILSATAPGFAAMSVARDIPEEGDLQADLTLQPGARLKGRAIGPDGGALPGVEVLVGESKHDWAKLATYTGDDGLFAFDAIPVGDTFLMASSGYLAEIKLPLHVPPGTLALPDADLVFDRGRDVSGRVTDVAGQPIEGVWVGARSGREYLGMNTVTSKEGSFTLPSLPEVEFTLEALHSDYMRASVEPAGGGETVIVLDRAGDVRGRVIDGQTGAPVDTFKIRLVDAILQENDEGVRSYSMSLVREGHSFADPEGRWSLDEEQFAHGRILGVEASATGYAPAIDSHVVVAPHSGGADGEGTVIRLWRAVDVSVSVVDEATGEPIADAQVRLTQERVPDEMDHVWSAKSDTRGIALVRGAAPGLLFVHVERSGSDAVTLGPLQVEPLGKGETGSRPIEVQVPAGAVR